MAIISEKDIEQALLARLNSAFKYDLLNCDTPNPETLPDGSGRTDKRDGALADRVNAAAVRLNPDIPDATIDGAVAKVMDRRAR